MLDENINENDPFVLNFYGPDSTFSLIASSSLSVLKGGEPVIGMASDGIMSYYKFIVSHPVKLIEISVIP